MNLVSVLLSPLTVISILLYLGLCIAAILASQWLITTSERHPVTHWLAEHLYADWLLLLPVIALVLMLYPNLFGYAEAPGLGEIFNPAFYRLNDMWTIMLLAGLLLPLLPFIGQRRSVIIPTQGVIAVTMLFFWMQSAMGLEEIEVTPEPAVVGIVLILGLLTDKLTQVWLYVLEKRHIQLLDVENWEALIHHLLMMAVQAPLLIHYGLSLGRQLAGASP